MVDYYSDNIFAPCSKGRMGEISVVRVIESHFEKEFLDRLGEITILIVVDCIVIKNLLDHSFDVR